MSADPNKKSPRTFQCRDALWEKFDQMAHELECSVDYLINDAMKQYAKQRNYVAAGSGATGNSGSPGSLSNAHSPPGGDFAPSPTHNPSPGYRAGTVPPTMQAGGRLPPPVAPNPVSFGNPLGRGASGTGLPPPPARGAAPPPNRGAGAQPAPGTRAPLGGQARGASGFPPPQQPGGGRTGPNNRGNDPAPAPTRERSVPPPLDGSRGGGAGGYGREQQAPAYGSNAANLTVIYNGERVGVAKDRFVIGRGKQSSDLTLKDPNVSRQHAMIEFQNGAYFMVDMGSTNGVEYNNQRIARKQIAEGDVFRICDHDLRFTFR